MRIYIDLPYSEKERAQKILGKALKYDFHSKCAYVESPENHDSIKHILTSSETANQGITYTKDPLIEFKAFLESQGLVINGLPVMDGAKHRTSVAGKDSKNRSGEYKGYLDGRPSGFVRNYISDVYQNWTFSGKIDNAMKMSKAEIAQNKYDRFLETEGNYREVSQKAQDIWDGIDTEAISQEHSYLKRKGVEIHGAKINENNLLVLPIRNINHKITNLQFISEDGTKNFLTGGRNKGSFFQIGYIREHSTVILCEGFATGATLNEVLDRPVICAINAGNLEDVAKAIREKYPKNMLVIAGDNDRHTVINDEKMNVGLLKAQKVLEILGENAAIVIPGEELSEGETDWNDYLIKFGKEKTTTALAEQGVRVNRRTKSNIGGISSPLSSKR
jgi:phage/plasmid primase-like uncharacterized protein